MKFVIWLNEFSESKDTFNNQTINGKHKKIAKPDMRWRIDATPIIGRLIVNKFKFTGEYILVIQGWCQGSTEEAFLELTANRLGVPYEKWSKIMKSITEQKELDLKKEFNNDANKEKKIDKSGL